MRKKNILSFIMVLLLVLGIAIPVSASNENRDCDGNMPEYIPIQVVMEVFYTDSGEIVSREYFDVYLPETELSQQCVGMVPFSTLERTLLVFQGGLFTRYSIGRVNAALNLLTHIRFVNFHSYSEISSVYIYVITSYTGTQLGSATLSPGQSLSILVPFNTISYNVWARNNSPIVDNWNGLPLRERGRGWFSVTS